MKQPLSVVSGHFLVLGSCIPSPAYSGGSALLAQAGSLARFKGFRIEPVQEPVSCWWKKHLHFVVCYFVMFVFCVFTRRPWMLN